MEIEIITNDYNFTYKDIKYEIDVINPKIEFYRKIEMLKIVNKLKNILEKYNIKYNNTLLYNVINRYILYYFSKVKYDFIDPLFPFIKNPEEYDKMTEFNIKSIFKTDKAKVITTELQLDKLFRNAIKNIKSVKNINNKETFDIELKNNKIYFKSKINDIFSYKIPINIYKKLEKDYKKYKNYNSHNYKLDILIYCLLIRYDTLFSRGNQWAMPVSVKKEFKKEFNINFEVFASSFNHYYDYYCSIFYDLEKYFMSIGYFQNVKYIKGFYMANPPYEEKLLNKMYSIIQKYLEETNKKLTFIVGTPSWDKYYFELHDIIKSSKYHAFSYKIENREVQWYDFMENKYMKIPSNIRYVLTNNKNLDIDKIKYIMDKYWTKRIR